MKATKASASKAAAKRSVSERSALMMKTLYREGPVVEREDGTKVAFVVSRSTSLSDARWRMARAAKKAKKTGCTL